jgi:hypothetical protein
MYPTVHYADRTKSRGIPRSPVPLKAQVVQLYAERVTESCSDILEPRSQTFRGESDLAELAHLIGENLRRAGLNCRGGKVGQSREESGK